MANRVTPVEAAKALNIRPQLVYGFIKHNRVATFPNPGGKTAFVDFDEVKRVAGQVRPHRAKDADGKPVRRSPGVDRGSLLSQHAWQKGSAKQRARPHRLDVVTEVIKNEEGDVSLVITQNAEGGLPMYWEAERLADRIKSGACHVESPTAVLGVLMHAWIATGEAKKAAALQMWCEVNEIEYEAINATVVDA